MKKIIYVLLVIALVLFFGTLNPSIRIKKIFDTQDNINKNLLDYDITEEVEYKELAVYEIEAGQPSLNFLETSQEVRKGRNDLVLDSKLYLNIWEYIKKIYPSQYVNKIDKLVIFNDGFGRNLINLNVEELTDNNNEKWTLAIDPEDVYDKKGKVNELSMNAVIHELGHLISIDSSQVDFDEELIESEGENYSKLFAQKQEKCLTYLVQEGCLKKESYLYKLYEKYWKGEVFDEFSRIQSIENRKEFNLEMENFENKYSDHFLTFIAAISPEEDLAELWTFYVYDYPVEGKIKAEKIKFISEFPELAKVKAEVLNNLKLLETEDE